VSLRQHINRDHGSDRFDKSRFHEVGLSLRCGVISCRVISTDTKSLVKHLHQHIKDGMSVICPIQHCSKRYCIRSSFSGHLSRDHSQWTFADLKTEISSLSYQQPTAISRTTTVDVPSFCNNDDDEVSDFSKADNGPSLFAIKDLFTKNMSLFFVKLMTQHMIPECVVELIAQELQNINAVNQQYLQQNIKQVLAENCINADHVDSILSAVSDSDLIKNCLDEGGILHTSHKRSSFIRKNCHYVQPESVYVGVDGRNKLRYAYYVPVKKSLEALLSDDTVLKQCLSTQFVDKNVPSDFMDGSVYKNCANRDNAETKCLSLILYEDAFEVANPLGSAKIKHKVNGFYFVLGNLQSHNRSAVDHIQLVMLAMEVDLVKVGQRMFRRLVDDLQMAMDMIEIRLIRIARKYNT